MIALNFKPETSAGQIYFPEKRIWYNKFTRELIIYVELTRRQKSSKHEHNSVRTKCNKAIRTIRTPDYQTTRLSDHHVYQLLFTSKSSSSVSSFQNNNGLSDTSKRS